MLQHEDSVLSRDEIDALADEIAVAACRVDSAQQVLLGNIRAFDRAKGWAWQGAKSCAAWLSWRVGCGRNAANERVRVATALGSLPRIDAAMAAGELSYCKVRAMTRVATPENEDLLLDQARSATGAELERICAGVRQALRPRGARGDDDVRYVRRRHVAGGMTRIEAQLYADEAERVWQALAAVRRDLEAAPSGRAPEVEVEVEVTPAGLEVAVAAESTPPALEVAPPALDGDDTERPGPRFAVDGPGFGGASSEAGSAPRLLGFRGNSRCGAASAEAHGSDPAGAHGADPTAAPAGARGSVGTRAPAWAPGSDGSAPPRSDDRPGLADALVAVAEAALARGLGARPRPAAERRQLLVHLSEDRLAALTRAARDAEVAGGVARAARDGAVASDGVALGAELHHGVWLGRDTALRIACDAGLVVAKTGRQGEVLDIGRRSRVVTATLLRALWMRDRGCRFPGCTQVAFVEAHHLEHWLHGGATSLANTTLLCHHHHVSVHEGGFGIERQPSGALRFTDPHGREICGAPAPPSLDEPALPALSRSERGRGIAITRTTSLVRRDFRRRDLRGATNAVVARTLAPRA